MHQYTSEIDNLTEESNREFQQPQKERLAVNIQRATLLDLLKLAFDFKAIMQIITQPTDDPGTWVTPSDSLLLNTVLTEDAVQISTELRERRPREHTMWRKKSSWGRQWHHWENWSFILILSPRISTKPTGSLLAKSFLSSFVTPTILYWHVFDDFSKQSLSNMKDHLDGRLPGKAFYGSSNSSSLLRWSNESTVRGLQLQQEDLLDLKAISQLKLLRIKRSVLLS
jgi:hypothetical protein